MIRGAKFNLKIPIYFEDINKRKTFYNWNAQPSELNKSIVMVGNRKEVLENTFLSPFHDVLDDAKLDDSIKENLSSFEEADKQLMSKYIERMSTFSIFL